MRNIARLTVGVAMALSATMTAAAAASAKSEASCSDAYGSYGYSAGYCEHSLYGRSSPADRIATQQNLNVARRDDGTSGRLAERQQDSDRNREPATQDREYAFNFADPDRG